MNYEYHIKVNKIKCTKLSNPIVSFYRLIILFSLLINSNYFFSQGEVKQESSQLEANVNYYAEDSMILDLEAKKTFLYKNAHIDYGEVILDACFIEFNFEDKTVRAKYCLDSSHSKIGLPVLSDGSTSTTSDSLKYNLKPKKGLPTKSNLRKVKALFKVKK